MSELEAIVPFPCPRHEIPKATQYRSTWLLASIQMLRDRGHFDAYIKALAPERRDEILFSVAGVWLSMASARAHYEACEALGLPADEQLAMGRSVSTRAQQTILGTVTKMARGVGVTPWTVLPQYGRLWHRGVDRGALGVFKVGPKEVRIEIVGCALFQIPYFRVGFRGVMLDVGGLFCKTAYVHEVPRAGVGDSLVLRFQWA